MYIYIYLYVYMYIYIYVWVWLEIGVCRGSPPSDTNPGRGPLCRVLQSSIGLSQGGFVARPPILLQALLHYKPDVFEPLPKTYMHIHIYMYRKTCMQVCVCVRARRLYGSRKGLVH